MIDVDVDGGAVRGLTRDAIRTFVNDSLTALRRVRAVRRPIDEVSIRFVDDETMRRLNREYRTKDKTTDVLTFAADIDDLPAGEPRPLGDIIISLPQAQRQARDEKHSLATEVRYLLLHGIIHALGYDHEADRGEMYALEQKIRSRVGLE